MDNDIVARLRESDGGYFVRQMFNDAANEIERLREMLRLEREECAACAIDRKETQRERDEAREEILELLYLHPDRRQAYADARGWYLYRKDGTNGD